MKWDVISVWFMSRVDNKGHDLRLNEHRSTEVLSVELKCYIISLTYTILHEHKNGPRCICPTSSPRNETPSTFQEKKKKKKNPQV